MYAPGLPLRAVFVKVPDVVRSLWRLQEQRSAKADIFEIEGIGPVAIAHTWLELLRGRPWLHVIDHRRRDVPDTGLRELT